MTSRIGGILATIAHLAIVGLVGVIAIPLWLGFVSFGVGMVFVLGLGLIFLAAAAWSFWPIARMEESRIAGLYNIAIPPRPMPRSRRTDWLRGPQTMVMQIVDAANLKAVANFVIATLLGLISLGLWQLAVFATGAAITGDSLSSALVIADPSNRALSITVGIGVTLAALAGIVGLAFAHQAISVRMLTPSREAQLAEQVRQTTQQRGEAVHAAEVERSRIERDLHDGVQPRLVSVGMTLGMAQAKLQSDPAAAAELIDEAHASTKAAITELRQLARGIHPAVLTDRGLDAALSALAARSPIPVQLDIQLPQRGSVEAEAALYFAIAESLTNIAKHSGAREARVALRSRPGNWIWARVEDDGIGGATVQPGGGLDGVANRIRAAGGSFTLTSPPSGPTTIEVSVPCAS